MKKREKRINKLQERIDLKKDSPKVPTALESLMSLEAFLDKLIEWGCEIEDNDLPSPLRKGCILYIPFDSNFTHIVEYSEVSELNYDSLEEVIKDSLMFTCCGDEVPTDTDLCPTCKEHL